MSSRTPQTRPMTQGIASKTRENDKRKEKATTV
jgi:hypothetical protein